MINQPKLAAIYNEIGLHAVSGSELSEGPDFLTA
jgi:hypothetical protein